MPPPIIPFFYITKQRDERDIATIACTSLGGKMFTVFIRADFTDTQIGRGLLISSNSAPRIIEIIVRYFPVKSTDRSAIDDFSERLIRIKRSPTISIARRQNGKIKTETRPLRIPYQMDDLISTNATS
jgi:hypothetical protein